MFLIYGAHLCPQTNRMPTCCQPVITGHLLLHGLKLWTFQTLAPLPVIDTSNHLLDSQRASDSPCCFPSFSLLALALSLWNYFIRSLSNGNDFNTLALIIMTWMTSCIFSYQNLFHLSFNNLLTGFGHVLFDLWEASIGVYCGNMLNYSKIC